MKVGLDVGNGSIVAAVANGSLNKLTADVMTSTYGIKPSIQMLVAEETVYPVYRFEHQQEEYVLGYDAILASRASFLDAYDRTNRYDNPKFQLLTKLALMEAVTQKPSNGMIMVDIGIGVPSEDYTIAIQNKIKEWFRKPIIFRKNDTPYTISVHHVEILSQPIAVILSLFYDDQGYDKDNQLRNQRILVIDGGSGTLDLAAFDRMAVTAQASETIGMNDVYRDTIIAIRKKEPKMRIDRIELEHQLRNQDDYDYKSKDPLVVNQKIVKHGNRELDITAIYQRVMDDTWTKIQRLITNHFPDQDEFDRILLAGGVAGAFATYFKSWNPNMTVIDQPQKAVAIGLCKHMLTLE